MVVVVQLGRLGTGEQNPGRSGPLIPTNDPLVKCQPFPPHFVCGGVKTGFPQLSTMGGGGVRRLTWTNGGGGDTDGLS